MSEFNRILPHGQWSRRAPELSRKHLSECIGIWLALAAPSGGYMLISIMVQDPNCFVLRFERTQHELCIRRESDLATCFFSISMVGPAAYFFIQLRLGRNANFRHSGGGQLFSFRCRRPVSGALL